MNKQRMDKKGLPVSFCRLTAMMAIIGGALASLIVSPRSEAANYTWNATTSRYWQNAFWTPDAGASGPGAADTIGATSGSPVGNLRLDANFALNYSVASFVRTGSGSWIIEALDNGRTSPASDPIRNVVLNITGALQSDSSAVTVFRSNTLSDTNKATLGLNIGGALWARSGDFYLGSASIPPSNYNSALSSLAVAGTTTINAGRQLALWVQPGQTQLGRVNVNGVFQIHRAGLNDVEGSVDIRALGGSGAVMVSDYTGITQTASLNINGGINGSFSGVASNGASGNILKVTKSGTGVQVFSGSNTYSGGTIASGGLLLAQNTAGSAFGSGTVQVTSTGTLGGNGHIAPVAGNNIVVDGTLRPGYYQGDEVFVPGEFLAATLSLDLSGSSKLVLNAASNLDYVLGSTSSSIAFGTLGDWLVGSGNATLALTLGNGFDYGNSYTIFSNVTTEGFTLAGVTGFDSGNYTWSLDQMGSDYVLSFQAIPEPSTIVLWVGASLGLVLFARRSREN